MFRKYILFLLFASAVATAQQAASPSSSSVLTLEEVLSKVVARNPALTAAQHSIEAQQHRVPQAGALPDPNLSVSWMGSAVPFKTMAGDPSSYRGISAMQMLPLGGKLGLQSKIARKDVTTAQDERVATERKLVADARAAYYDYYFYGKALEITNRDKKRLEQLADISESRYRVGKAMQQDVLRAHVEVSMLLQRAVTFEQQREIAAARLNTLMGAPPTAALPPAAEVQESRLPELSLLASMAEKSDPVLQREQTQVEKNKLGIELARKQYIPDLSVGYMYQQRPAMPDMYGMQFTVNIPIFYKKKQREAIEQAKQEELAAKSNVDSRRLEIDYELKQMHALAENSQKLLDLYKSAIIPQAELALESSQSSYGVGNVDFLSVVTNFTTINSYEIDYYRQLADYQTALARIEALTGELNTASEQEKNQ